IAQKISEKQAEGTPFSPASPKEGRTTPSSSPLCNRERFSAFKQALPPPTAPKPQRFPSNISITNVGEREFSKTISRAAVNVQERKARVLANVNGSPYFISELEERLQKHDLSGQSRSSSLRDLPPEQPLSNGYRNIHDVLRRETSHFPSVSKTVTVKPDADLPDGKPARQNAAKSFCDHRLPDLSLEMRRRSGSLPRPSGLRPQGVTVQFSGRGSTEEARREALRKLGLLKD
uniref:Proline and serine rich 2 n=1 Tax=Podarcis muralis TaxID=64176 RepID=A0A670KJ02_PODMU